MRISGNSVDRVPETWFTLYMTTTEIPTETTSQRVERITAWYITQAENVEALAAERKGEVRKSLLRSADYYRHSAAQVERIESYR